MTANPKTINVRAAFEWSIRTVLNNWAMWVPLTLATFLVWVVLWVLLQFYGHLIVFMLASALFAIVALQQTQHPRLRLTELEFPRAFQTLGATAVVELIGFLCFALWLGIAAPSFAALVDPYGERPPTPLYADPAAWFILGGFVAFVVLAPLCSFLPLAAADGHGLLAATKRAAANWLRLMALEALSLLTLLIGAVCIGVGLLVAVPIVVCAFAHAYCQAVGRTVEEPTEPTAPTEPTEPTEPEKPTPAPTPAPDENPYAQASNTYLDPQAWSTEPGTGRVRVGRAFSWAWAAFTGNWATCVQLTFAFLVISVVAGNPLLFIVALFLFPAVWFVVVVPFAVSATLRQTDRITFSIGEAKPLHFAQTVVVGLFAAAISWPVPSAVHRALHQTLPWDVPEGTPMGPITLGIGLLCYLAVSPLWALMPFFAADGAGIGQAIGRGFRRGVRNYFPLLALALACTVLNILGAAVLGLGLLVTIPLSLLAYAHAYREASRGPVPVDKHSTYRGRN